jgi:hypothetical protein
VLENTKARWDEEGVKRRRDEMRVRKVFERSGEGWI